MERQASGVIRKSIHIRKVNNFIVFIDDVLGMGQFGKVCKA